MVKSGPAPEGYTWKKYLRAIGIASLIIGVVFKLQQWPGAQVFFYLACGILLMVLLIRLIRRGAIDLKETSRDLFAFGGVSMVCLRFLHYPGTTVALVVMVLGGLGILWYDRERFLPGTGTGDMRPWLFYPAFALVITGMIFRIQHWPHSTPLLISGLVLVAVWFFSTGQEDGKEE
jgi:hypothetical protein